MNIDLNRYSFYKTMLYCNTLRQFFKNPLYEEPFNACIDTFESLLIDSINHLKFSFSGYLNTVADSNSYYLEMLINDTIIMKIVPDFDNKSNSAMLKSLSMRISSNGNTIYISKQFNNDYFNIDTNIKYLFSEKFIEGNFVKYLNNSTNFFELFNLNFFHNSKPYLNHFNDNSFLNKITSIIQFVSINYFEMKNEYFDFNDFENSLELFYLKHDIIIKLNNDLKVSPK